MSRARDLERLYASYGGKIQFIIVYIREAHPNLLKAGNDTGIIGRPKNFNERIILATKCVTRYKFSMPMVVDSMAGTVNSDYKAAPVRTYITDKDGKIVYYGARGPWGFKIPEIERALKKVAANDGYMPPPSAPQWGRPVNGLRCGLSIDPADVTLGDGVAVQLQFENTTNEPISIYYQTAQAAKNLTVSNGAGETLTVRTAAAGSRRSRTMRGPPNPVHTIQPGQKYETQFDAELTAPSNPAAPAPGKYSAKFDYEVRQRTLAAADLNPNRDLWMGKLASGNFALQVRLPRKEGCIDCHANDDYHHIVLRPCAGCHVGRVGSDDFDTKKDACATCHPRPGVQGRRKIVGHGGEFQMLSRHIPGRVDNDDCLLCHDNTKHANGLVSLVDPHSAGTKPWTGTLTQFCLTCHDGDPPDAVTFPAQSKGSGYDKSHSADPTHGKDFRHRDRGCLHCHNSHGSPHPSLLRIGP